jgi:GNAT superfamily N-acetyltransferase
MLQFEVADTMTCRDPEIRGRMAQSPKARHTQHYIVTEDDVEVGFLSLDLIPRVDYLVLYEIYVPKRLRRKGIGSRLIQEVESIARSHGYARVTLSPSPLDTDYSATTLINWYKARHYQERADYPAELEKNVS